VKVLAIETSSTRGAVALLDDDTVLDAKAFGECSRHGRDLLPCVDKLLGGEPGAVGLLAVSIGPGSYTGLRVGLAFAKTFAAETGTPVVGVSSLDVIAANVSEARRVCVVVDARLGRVYAALYEGDRKVLDDAVARPEEIARQLKSDVLVVGDALRRHGAAFAEVAEVSGDESLWRPMAANVGRLGWRKFVAEGGDAPETLRPRYLARPQAEVKWEESQNASGPK